jgi:hypothetical protein
VIIVLLNVAATWATPEVMFLRSFLRVREAVAGFAMSSDPIRDSPHATAAGLGSGWRQTDESGRQVTW